MSQAQEAKAAAPGQLRAGRRPRYQARKRLESACGPQSRHTRRNNGGDIIELLVKTVRQNRSFSVIKFTFIL